MKPYQILKLQVVWLSNDVITNSNELEKGVELQWDGVNDKAWYE